MLVRLENEKISYQLYDSKKGYSIEPIKEKTFDTNDGYEKYAAESNYDKAYDFLVNICEKCREYQTNILNTTSGIKIVVDLSDMEVCNYFHTLKEQLEKTEDRGVFMKRQRTRAPTWRTY